MESEQILSSTFQVISLGFCLLWLWSSWLLGRATSALKKAQNSAKAFGEAVCFADLSNALLANRKLNMEVQKSLIDSMQAMNDNLRDYNRELHQINSMLRTKVEKSENVTIM